MTIDWNFLLGKLIETSPAIIGALSSAVVTVLGGGLLLFFQHKWKENVLAKVEQKGNAMLTQSKSNREVLQHTVKQNDKIIEEVKKGE